MALIIADRVREVVSLTGTGNVPLLGVAPVGFQSFVSAVGEGNTTYYAIVSGSGQWETGLGTITSGQLVRTEVYDSSTGAKVDFTAGTKEVFCTPVAAKQVVLNPDGSLTLTQLNGNASTATTLQTARLIGGVSFNGSANIDLPGVNTAGNQDTSGNAASATVLQTARTIGGVSFNGSANIDLPGVNTTGNQDTSGNAAGTESDLSAPTGAAMVGANAYQTQADINAEHVSVAAHGASVSPSDAKAAIQSTVDSFSSGTVQRGAFRFPPGKDYSVSGEVLIHRKTLDIDGQNAAIKWEGPNTASMFRVTDSARVSFRNLALLGDLETPPIAALFFDSPVLGTEGSNENHIIENVVIGRLYTSDTTTGGSADATPYGKVQYGIRVGGAVDGNNDEYTIRNVQVHGASVAAVSFDNSQGIWSMLDHVLVNDSAIGVRAGCNLTIRNLHANRNTSADLEGIRNTETNVDTFNTENSVLPIWSKAGASFYVWSGKWILSAAAPGNFVRVESGGSLLLDGMTIQFAGASAQTFYYRSSTGKGGKISVKNSTIENGSARNTWDIDTGGGTTAVPVAIDIEHGSFKWVQSERSPYLDRAVTPPAVAAAASGLIGSGAAKTPFGTFFNVALSTPLMGQHLTSAYEQIGQIRARLFNATAGSITLPACRARWMSFEEHITARASASINAPSLANNTGHTATINLPGAKLGDYVVCAQGASYLNSVVTCYVQADNTVAVRIHNASGGISDPPDTLFYVGKVAEFGNFHGTAAYTPAAIANAASITVTVSVPGAQVGGHVFATYSADMQGLTHGAEVSAADTVTITVTNYTGASVTLGAGYFRAMVAF